MRNRPYTRGVSFAVGADAYDRFMGRYSSRLAPRFADFAGVTAGQRVIDVGSGPGAVVTELVGRVPADAVWAVDPSERFVAALRDRHPGVRAQCAVAEDLPFQRHRFDAALAQLVVHFMTDPVQGIREMARVTRPQGTVAACVWDHGGGQGPLGAFWEAARALDPGIDDESQLAGARQGHLGELFAAAGLHEVRETALVVEVTHPTFEEWWEPFLLGVGPAGVHLAGLGADDQARVREQCRRRLPAEPLVVSALAWAARGLA